MCFTFVQLKNSEKENLIVQFCRCRGKQYVYLPTDLILGPTFIKKISMHLSVALVILKP